MRNLVISKYFLWWFVLYWVGLKLETNLYNWVNVSFGVVFRWWKRVVRCWNTMYLFIEGGSSVGRKWGYLHKGNFVWSRNITCEDICEERFQNLLKSCVSFGEGLEGSNEEKMERWKNVVSFKEWACEIPVGFPMCPSIETVKYIWVNIWCMLDWILSQNCKNTLSLHVLIN